MDARSLRNVLLFLGDAWDAAESSTHFDSPEEVVRTSEFMNELADLRKKAELLAPRDTR